MSTEKIILLCLGEGAALLALTLWLVRDAQRRSFGHGLDLGDKLGHRRGYSEGHADGKAEGWVERFQEEYEKERARHDKLGRFKAKEKPCSK